MSRKMTSTSPAGRSPRPGGWPTRAPAWPSVSRTSAPEARPDRARSDQGLAGPLRSRPGRVATGPLAKTDALEAGVIAHFAEAVHPTPRPRPDEMPQQLDALRQRRRQLLEMVVAERQRMVLAHPTVRDSLACHLDDLQRRIDEADAKSSILIRTTPVWRETDDILPSTPGIGPVLSATLQAALPEWGGLNPRDIAKLVGVAPLEDDRGKHAGARPIRGGRAEVRAVLSMATLTAPRGHPVISAFSPRVLARGKAHKGSSPKYVSHCPTQRGLPSARQKPITQAIAAKVASLRPLVDERARRLWAAVEARAIGRGGISRVAEATGRSRVTIRAGLHELTRPGTTPGPQAPPERRRRPRGGRTPLRMHAPHLVPALETWVDPVTRGDPMSRLRGTCKRAAQVAAALQTQGHAVRERTVHRLLHDLGYRLQANRKPLEGRAPPEREAQWHDINRRATAVQKPGHPVVSGDPNTKELIGQFRNGGREWPPQGQPEEVPVDDCPDKVLGKVIPYGVYDAATNTGGVSVGVDHDTAACAVATIRRWWRHMGSKA